MAAALLMAARRVPYIWTMVEFLPGSLTDPEWRALGQLSRDADTSSMPVIIQARLELLGYAQKFYGGLLITDEELLQLQIGKEKPAD